MLKELLQEKELTRGKSMDFSGENLNSLNGRKIPNIIEGDFYCNNTELTSLEFGPQEVTENFFCYDNRLSNLKHSPIKVGETFDCSHNVLTSLEFCVREVGKDFYCNHNALTSLEFMPTKVGGDCYCGSNHLTSFQGIHKLFKYGYIKGTLILDVNPITSHILGLLLIPKLKKIRYNTGGNKDCIEVIDIINTHLNNRRDAIDCQEELIQKGFKEFAQL